MNGPKIESVYIFTFLKAHNTEITKIQGWKKHIDCTFKSREII